MSLNRAIKKLFFTTSKLNIALHLTYITSKENDADAPSRRLTTLDCKLHPKLWQRVQQEFGGPKGHTCDLMALDSNAMTDQDGSCYPILRPTHRRNPVVSISLRKIYQVEPRFWSTLTFSRLSLSDGSCSAFSETPRAVVHGHSLGCLSEKVLMASYPKLCQ